MDPNVCPGCGGDKYPDASLCEACWKRQRIYHDGRD